MTRFSKCLCLGCTVGLLAACAEAPQQPDQVALDDASYRITTVRGVVPNVDGRTAIVEILAAVEADRDPEAAAWEKLQRMEPTAVPFGQWRYALNGLYWEALPVVVNYNTKYEPDPAASGTFMDSWGVTWNGAPSSFAFAFGEYTGRCPSLVDECRGPQKFDGYNDVAWLALSEPGVIGVTWYSTQIDEFDMALDYRDFDWYFGEEAGHTPPLFDAWTIWSHEFGHALGLSHTTINTALMWPYYPNSDGQGGYNWVQRELHPDDLAGLQELYGVEQGCTDDADCDDGEFCNGAETCNAGACESGAAPCADDGVACTDDCNEASHECDYFPDDGNCPDDGRECSIEWCDAVEGCSTDESACPDCGGKGDTCTTGADCCSGLCHPVKLTCK